MKLSFIHTHDHNRFISRPIWNRASSTNILMWRGKPFYGEGSSWRLHSRTPTFLFSLMFVGQTERGTRKPSGGNDPLPLVSTWNCNTLSLLIVWLIQVLIHNRVKYFQVTLEAITVQLPPWWHIQWLKTSNVVANVRCYKTGSDHTLTRLDCYTGSNHAHPKGLVTRVPHKP